MKLKLLTIVAICISISACGGGGSSSSNNGSGNSPIPPSPPSESATPTPVPEGGNYVHIQITPGSPTTCSATTGYLNAPCVSVTICQPGTTNCDTVNNVLVDSGSYGLRVFKSVLPHTGNSLTPMISGNSQPVFECVGYADGTGNWGPVEYANITLNNTTTTESIPIQILEAASPGVPLGCQDATTDPSDFGLNGIMGVGPLPSDQGTSTYYTCSGSSCTSITPPSYLPNPITQLGTGNNNGIALTFGPISQNGATSADGYGIFGIGTNASNTPSQNASIFQIRGGSYPVNVTTHFQGITPEYDSFLDTGSNFFYFSNAFLPLCTDGSGSFCPAGFTPEIATMIGSNGLGSETSTTVNFTIGNALSLVSSGNTAFSTIGYGDSGLGSNIIDWGMPFFYGKTVYIVFASTQPQSLNNGITLPPSALGYWIY